MDVQEERRPLAKSVALLKMAVECFERFKLSVPLRHNGMSFARALPTVRQQDSPADESHKPPQKAFWIEV